MYSVPSPCLNVLIQLPRPGWLPCTQFPHPVPVPSPHPVFWMCCPYVWLGWQVWSGGASVRGDGRWYYSNNPQCVCVHSIPEQKGDTASWTRRQPNRLSSQTQRPHFVKKWVHLQEISLSTTRTELVSSLSSSVTDATHVTTHIKANLNYR